MTSHFRGNHDHIKIVYFLVILVNLGVIMTSHYCVQQVPTCAWLDFWHNGHAAGKVGMQSKWQGQFFNAPFISSNNHDSSKYMKCGLLETSLFTPLTLQPFYILGSGNLNPLLQLVSQEFVTVFGFSANIVLYLACHFNHCTFMCRISCNKSSYEDLANSLPYSWIH